eukprot:1960241-Prymnesium_polylepis.1
MSVATLVRYSRSRTLRVDVSRTLLSIYCTASPLESRVSAPTALRRRASSVSPRPALQSYLYT